MAVEYGGLKSNFKAQGWTPLGALRMGCIFFASVPILILQAGMIKFSRKRWWPVAAFWHRTMCRILGLEIRVLGAIKHPGPILYASNHVSWLDIIILGGLLENASFIAKSEMAQWGFLGTMCGLHKTVFVNRTRRTDAKNQADRLTDRIKDGDSLILFPEGTSTDGGRVVPFKSSLFSVAERADEASDHRLQIQPLTLAFTEMNGIPLVRSQRPLVAWLGDVELFDHLRQFLALARTVVTIEYHKPITFQEAGCRKTLATYCEQEVRGGLERAARLEMRMGRRAERASSATEEAGSEPDSGRLQAHLDT